jgi:hypothetical protein
MHIKHFKYGFVAAIASLVSISGVISFQIPKAYAGCGFWETVDPTNPNCTIKDGINNTIYSDFNVNVKNNSKETIWVATHYYVAEVKHEGESCSTIDGAGENCPNEPAHWATAGYWKLEPGQKAYIKDTVSRAIYFHAHSENGTYWGNEDTSWVVGNEGVARPFFEVDMGRNFVNFTQTFN